MPVQSILSCQSEKQLKINLICSSIRVQNRHGGWSRNILCNSSDTFSQNDPRILISNIHSNTAGRSLWAPNGTHCYTLGASCVATKKKTENPDCTDHQGHRHPNQGLQDCHQSSADLSAKESQKNGDLRLVEGIERSNG